MHRTSEDRRGGALDANNTIARANRDDFDRAGVRVVNFMGAPGAGKTGAARAGRHRPAGRPWPCSRATCRGRWTPTGSRRCTCR